MVMTEQETWNLLAKDRPDLYTPNKLPFFKPDQEEGIDARPGSPAKPDVIRMQRVKSTTSEAQKLFDMNRTEVDTEVKNLLYDEQSQSIACSEDEAILVQLPGTLPFKEVTPHASNALEDMIEMLSSGAPAGKSAFGQLSSEGENIGEDNAGMVAEPPKIGKLRVMKSGKVIMRLQLPG